MGSAGAIKGEGTVHNIVLIAHAQTFDHGHFRHVNNHTKAENDGSFNEMVVVSADIPCVIS